MKKKSKRLKFFLSVFIFLALFFFVSSRVVAFENSFDYVSGISYEPIAKLVNFLNDKKSELERYGDRLGKPNTVRRSVSNSNNANAKKSFLLSAVLETAKDAIIGKPKQYFGKVFCVAKDFVFPGACRGESIQDYNEETSQQERTSVEDINAIKQQYEGAIMEANILNQKFNQLQQELGKIKAGGVVIKEPIIEQKTVERTIEKIVSGLSQDDLSAGIASIRTELNNLNTNLTNQINNLSSNTSRQTTAVYQAVSLTNRIDNLTGTSLTRITVNGVTGLTDSDIPDGITASNYLPLIGGTISGDLTINGNATLGVITLQNATAGYFTATSTAQSSTFPYASTTALTVSGSAYIGSLNGPLQANGGLVSATTSIGYQYGGTGLTATPSFGQMLRGTGSGYALVATSSLGINTTDITEGTNLYWTSDRFDNRLSATTTLPNITTLANLATVGTITSGTWGGTTLAINKGGTGQTTFGQGWLNSDGTTLSASTSPTVNYLTATSTTATSTFAGGLSIAGHCVTGDTRLRRRRKKKNGEGYDYDEVMIKDIQAGDEIASLDEKTGKIVWSKVNALMDMGVKEIYKLTTAGGKTIRTTAEHPYLIKKKEAPSSRAIAFIDYANIKAWIRGKNLSVDLKALYSALKGAGVSDVRFYYGTDAKNDKIGSFFSKLSSFGYSVITKPVQYFKIALLELLNQQSNKRWLETMDAPLKTNLLDEAVKLDEQGIEFFVPKANFDVEITADSLKATKDYDQIILFSGDGDFAYLLKTLKKLGKRSVVVSGRKSLSGSLIKEADKFVTLERFGEKIPRLFAEKQNPPHGRVLKKCVSNITDLLGLSNYCPVDNSVSIKEGSWTKVVYLKEGMEIAVSDKGGNEAVWDKISKIEVLSEEQVYDIEVDGTHNFIGNDIVAHNTYVGGSASATNLIVSNSSVLGTVSSGLWNGTAVAAQYGGTGQNFSASSGLMNLYSGTASAIATSSLGLLTTNVAEGSNQYWTNDRFDNRLSATTTLPNITTLANLATVGIITSGTWSGSTIAVNKGGTGQTSFGQGWLNSDGTTLSASTSPTVNYITATSTTATSTFATGGLAVGTNQFVVQQTSGNVGIGTAGPQTELHVLGSGELLRLQDNGVTGTDNNFAQFLTTADSGKGIYQGVDVTNRMFYWRLNDSNDYGYQWQDAAGDEKWMTIQANTGNVGIGTAGPGGMLDVTKANIGATNIFSFANTDNTNTVSNARLKIASGGSSGGNPILQWTVNGAIDWYANIDNSDSDKLKIGTSISDSKLVIDATGNVGIGTTTPSAKLDISAGNIDIDNTTNANQYGIITKNGTRFIHNFNYGNNGTVTTSGYNTFVGENAGNLTMGSAATVAYEASYNTANGYASLYSNTTGYNNTANGYASLYSNTTGYNNTANGLSSLLSNTTGYNNTANGLNSLLSNTTGYNNTANGVSSLYSNTTGYNNTANGLNSIYSNTTGIGNIGLGHQAGYGDGTTADQRSVIDNYMTFLGYQASRDASVASTTVLTNATAIGKNAKVGQSNTIVLGGTGADAVNVGIGTTSPNQKLSVYGNVELQGAAGATRYVVTDETNTGTGKLIMQAGAGSANYGGGINLYANSHATNPGSVVVGLSNNASAKFRVNQAGLDGGTDLFTVLETGNVGIGTTTPWRTLSVTGTVGMSGLTSTAGAGEKSVCIDPTTKEIKTSSGTDCTSSSGRFKKDISALSSGLSELLLFNPVSFRFNSGDETTHLGFIAEEINSIDSRLVDFGQDGLPRGVRYAEMTSLITKAIQDLNLKVDDLQASAAVSGGQTTDSLFSWILGKFYAIGITFGQDKLGAKKGVFESFEMKDASTGEDYCVKIRNGEWEKIKGTCGETSLTSSSVSSSSADNSSSSSSTEASSSSVATSSSSSSETVSSSSVSSETVSSSSSSSESLSSSSSSSVAESSSSVSSSSSANSSSSEPTTVVGSDSSSEAVSSSSATSSSSVSSETSSSSSSVVN